MLFAGIFIALLVLNMGWDKYELFTNLDYTNITTAFYTKGKTFQRGFLLSIEPSLDELVNTIGKRLWEERETEESKKAIDDLRKLVDFYSEGKFLPKKLNLYFLLFLL